MKSKIFLLALLVAVTSSCGKGSEKGSSQNSSTTALSAQIASIGLAGTWLDAAIGDQMVIHSDGSYTSSMCGSVGNITAISPIDISSCPVGAKACGIGTVNIVSFNGSGSCLPVGNSICAYALTTTSLIYNCGGSSLTYQKI